MKYYCTSCGGIFEEPESYSECIGEFWGAPAYQDFAECPYCGGGFEEAEPCGTCGEEFNPDDLICFPNSNGGTICRDCFKEYEKYRDDFLALPVPFDAGWTWQGYLDDDRQRHKDMDFFRFIGYEDDASEAFYLYCKERMVRDAAERGMAANVKVHYTEVRK